MEVFKNIGKKVAGAAQTTAKKSSGLVEITKLKTSISSEQDKIEKLYTKLGKKLYEEFHQNMDLDEKLNLICKKISSHNKTIETLKNKILEIKELKLCPNCGLEMEKDLPYCSRCGTKQPTPEVTLQEAPVLCPVCNKKLDNTTAFCSFCGTQITQ